MKIAVLITGQLRDYKINCINHLKHIIEPNNADVFVYACSKNTLHTTGNNITQNYKVTTTSTKEEIESQVKEMKNNLNALGGALQQTDLFVKQIEDAGEPMPEDKKMALDMATS